VEQTIADVFSQYAYTPWLVYGAVCLFMILSAFGLPLPEELVLISAGFVGYMALHPELYPPPAAGAQGVNVYILAAVSFLAVIGSDFLIYSIGHHLGPRLFKFKWFTRLVSDEALARVRQWMHRWGYWTVVLFRFTPGVRFPGHLICGAMNLSRLRFLAIDSIAAGLTVPTQVLLVSFYGEYILKYFKQFKIYVLSIAVIGFCLFLAYKWVRERRPKTTAATGKPPF
jgi:membrane protein DedA with SNARE-associated domain